MPIVAGSGEALSDGSAGIAALDSSKITEEILSLGPGIIGGKHRQSGIGFLSENIVCLFLSAGILIIIEESVVMLTE